jgi:hypothetical protein
MAFHADPIQKKANFYSIKESTFRLRTDKDDPEATRREYTNPKTGEEGVAYERAFKALYGVISDVSFSDNALKDGTVLRSLHIGLGDDENGIAQIISIPVDSRFATDFMKRLPNLDLSKEVRLAPYDFEPSEGPRHVGISITTKDDADNFSVKVDNNFFTKVEEIDGRKKYTNLHGYPEATEEDAEDWSFYFKKVNKFLVSYTKSNILPKLANGTDSVSPMPKSYEEQELNKEFKKESFKVEIGEDFP